MKKYLLRSSIVVLFLFSFIFRNNIFNFISYLNYMLLFDDTFNTNELLRIENINLKKELNDLLLLNNIYYEGINIINSKVIMNNIFDNKEFTINKGNNDNVKTNSIVVNSNGLIGVVKKVYKDYSLCDLIHNKNISVKINNNYYILKYNEEFYIDNISNINKFDVVYTSGISSYPEGIVVGYVYSIIGSKAYIRSKVNFETINYVSILEV